MSSIHKVILSLVIITIGFVGETYGQLLCADGSNSCQYIYRIKVSGKSQQTGKNWSTYMTGFKPEGSFPKPELSYLITALHGAVKGVEVCGSLSALTFTADHVTDQARDKQVDYDLQYTMKVCGIDQAKDLLYLSFDKSRTPRQLFDPNKQPDKNQGLRMADSRVKNTHKLIVQGFSVYKGRTKPVQQDYNPYSKLGKLFIPKNEEQKKKLEKLIAPNIDCQVMALNANDIQAGDSGAPILGTTPSDNQLVYGVGNGARLDRLGSPVVSWIIPVTKGDLAKPQVGDKIVEEIINKIIVNHREIGIELEMNQNSTDQPLVPESPNGSPFAFPKVKPFITVGGNVSWLAHYKEQVLEFSKRPGDPGTFLDLYAEVSLKHLPWLRLGAYGTSSYLQYEFLRTFDNGLIFRPDALNGVDQGWFKQVGLQASISLWRGVLWEGYVGGGMLPLKVQSWQPNKRAFFGVRHYLVARRWLAAEGRILWMSPDIQVNTWRPRLGNAIQSSQTINLNNFYVCAGLCLVIPHR